jgi:non-specific serine/threonine protein kinase
LEPVRQYGREHLKESEEADTIQHRHATFFLVLAEKADPELRKANQAAWVERLEKEYENLRTALSWVLGSGQIELGLRLSAALGYFWGLQGHASEGFGWMEAALASGEEASPARAEALAHAGFIAWQEGAGVERATAFGKEALTFSRKLGDKRSIALALYKLGITRLYQMELEEDWVIFEEALGLWRELGGTWGTSRTLLVMGLVSVTRHDLERAEALYKESLTLARKAEDKTGIAFALLLGALAALGRDDHEQVRGLCEEGLGLAWQLRNPLAVTLIVHVLAASTGSQGLAVRSARLWGAAQSLTDSLGRPALGPAERHLYGPYIAAARAQLGEAAWEVAWAEGKAMTQEAAVEYALSEKELTSSEESGETALGVREEILTRREQEVAVLLARGLTNRQIAAELMLSEHTVTTHVRNILKKLGLHSRTEVAAWVTRR